MKQIKILLFICACLLTCSSLLAQQEGASMSSQASQYYLGSKDEILIKVNIWGYVRKPGQYLVPRNTDLISLISFAGGPTDGANLGEVKLIREDLTGRNGHNGEERNIVKVNVREYVETGDSKLIPPLTPNDTVVITQSFGDKVERFLGIGSVVGIIAAGASLAIIIERL